MKSSKKRFGCQYRCKCITCGNFYVVDEVLKETTTEKVGTIFKSGETLTTAQGCYMCGSKKVSKVEQVG